MFHSCIRDYCCIRRCSPPQGVGWAHASMPLYLLHEDVLDVCLWVSANLRPVLNHAAAAVISDLPLVAGMHGSVDVSHNIIVSHHMHSWEDRHEAHKDARFASDHKPLWYLQFSATMVWLLYSFWPGYEPLMRCLAVNFQFHATGAQQGHAVCLSLACTGQRGQERFLGQRNSG